MEKEKYIIEDCRYNDYRGIYISEEQVRFWEYLVKEEIIDDGQFVLHKVDDCEFQEI